MLRRTMSVGVLVAVIGGGLCGATAQAQFFDSTPIVVTGQEDAIVNASAQVLNEVMAIPAQGIPRSLLADAQGLVIIPRMLKGGFVLGMRHGRGVLVVRDAQTGAWRAPVFVTITGGSIGWQIGVQSTDLVLVFRTQRSLQNIMNGKFTIGGDAAVAAGPVGRAASAATDARLGAEILSYSRSRGLFAGVALDGSVLQIDNGANALFYPPAANNQPRPLPASAVRLLNEVAQYTNPAPAAAAAAQPVPEIGQVAAEAPLAPVPNLQQQLAEASIRMNAVLDDQWKQYFTMPAELYAAEGQPSAASLNTMVQKFQAVAANPQYQALTQRPEFQETFRLLQQYAAQQAPTLTLPPPPGQ